MRTAIGWRSIGALMLASWLPWVAAADAARSAAPEHFRLWVDARAGTGTPVYWVAEGGVYAYPSGEKLFGMIGFDASTVIWPDEAGGDVVHLTRKTFTYTDPQTGEILTEFNGEPVEPIAYPYQVITYRLDNGIIHGDVEQGVGSAVQKIRSNDGMRTRWLGDDTLAVSAAVFLDIPLGGDARLEAWENYDFFLHAGDAVDEPHQLSWQRYGDLPRFAGPGKAIYHLLSWRVEQQADIPPQILNWAKRDMPMWLRPPADLAEVRRLQEGGGSDQGWSTGEAP